MLQKGRIKIFCDIEQIDRNNILEVLPKAYAKHRINVSDIQTLIDFDAGEQPLKREKTVRPEIDIRVNSGLPNYIKKFKIGYNWGSPIMLVQRGNKEFHDTDSDVDDTGISALNEVLKNGECIGYKDQCMAEFIEISGIGHRMVEPKKFTNNIEGIQESLVNIYTLDSRYAFVVYYNGPGQPEVLGVSYAKRCGKLCFTCFTNTTIYEIKNWEIVAERPNLLGMIPIVEYERSVDRTGCFERAIPQINALNIMESDFANDTAQHTQEIWWADNVDFKDADGNDTRPKSGDWVQTYSTEGRQAKIAPLANTFDRGATLTGITNQRNAILKDCYVPIQYDSSGGGSTGTATDMSSGWSAAELDALQEQQMTDKGKREELRLILRAINLVPTRILPEDSPIRHLHSSDIELKHLRKQNFDMSIRANTFATYVSHGINGRHALELTGGFCDVQQTWLDSREGVEAYQKSAYENSAKASETNNTSSDVKNQTGNSPILGGMDTDKNRVQV